MRYGRCEDCGQRHCVCGEPCQCGECNWQAHPYSDDYFHCLHCGTGPKQYGRTHKSVHVARKFHGISVKPGDTYQRVVQFAHFPGGAYTLEVRKYLVKKGPLWTVADIMNS